MNLELSALDLTSDEKAMLWVQPWGFLKGYMLAPILDDMQCQLQAKDSIITIVIIHVNTFISNLSG